MSPAGGQELGPSPTPYCSLNRWLIAARIEVVGSGQLPAGGGAISRCGSEWISS